MLLCKRGPGRRVRPAIAGNCDDDDYHDECDELYYEICDDHGVDVFGKISQS